VKVVSMPLPDGIAEDADARGVVAGQPGRRARQVQLDDFRRAGAYQEQQPDIGAAFQQSGDRPVQLLVHVGHPGQIALLDDGGGEARLREDHDAGGRLNQVGAGARADYEEESILDLAVKPDDAGQAAEHLALTALAQYRRAHGAASSGGPAGRFRSAGRRAA
jgi:hypothetical protein